MTDEEKAMTQFKNTICAICEDKDVCDVSILDCACYDSIYRQPYLDGLAEGRKEEQEKTCYCEHIQHFEKEVAELKEQNKDLCESLDIMNNRESDLLEQIEKMKCCENCKHHDWNNGDLDCRLKYSCYDTNYDKWEMM